MQKALDHSQAQYFYIKETKQGLVSSASGSGDGVVWLLVQSLSSPSVEVSLSKTTNRKLAVRPAWPTPPPVCRVGECEAVTVKPS